MPLFVTTTRTPWSASNQLVRPHFSSQNYPLAFYIAANSNENSYIFASSPSHNSGAIQVYNCGGGSGDSISKLIKSVNVQGGHVKSISGITTNITDLVKCDTQSNYTANLGGSIASTALAFIQQPNVGQILIYDGSHDCWINDIYMEFGSEDNWKGAYLEPHDLTLNLNKSNFDAQGHDMVIEFDDDVNVSLINVYGYYNGTITFNDFIELYFSTIKPTNAGKPSTGAYGETGNNSNLTNAITCIQIPISYYNNTETVFAAEWVDSNDINLPLAKGQQYYLWYRYISIPDGGTSFIAYISTLRIIVNNQSPNRAITVTLPSTVTLKLTSAASERTVSIPYPRTITCNPQSTAEKIFNFTTLQAQNSQSVVVIPNGNINISFSTLGDNYHNYIIYTGQGDTANTFIAGSYLPEGGTTVSTSGVQVLVTQQSSVITIKIVIYI